MSMVLAEEAKEYQFFKAISNNMNINNYSPPVNT